VGGYKCLNCETLKKWSSFALLSENAAALCEDCYDSFMQF